MNAREPLVPVLLEKVYNLIQDKVAAEHQKVVTQLAKHLFSHISHDDLISRNESDLYGAVVSLWQHMKETPHQELSVRVFNPTLSRHGWQSTHTIVEILLPDSPFLVDSIKMTLSRLGLSSHVMLHGPAQINVNKQGKIEDINAGKTGTELLSVFHLEVDRLSNKAQMQELESELFSVLGDVQAVVNDWQPMSKALNDVVKQVKSLEKIKSIDNEHIQEAIDFLNWVGDHNFTFMGYKEYRLVDQKRRSAS